MLHAPAATPSMVVAHQCIIPSEQPCTTTKPAAANTQCNQNAVQSSTEPNVPAPPSVPANNVPAISTSHTSMVTHQLSHTCCVPECLIEQI